MSHTSQMRHTTQRQIRSTHSSNTRLLRIHLHPLHQSILLWRNIHNLQYLPMDLHRRTMDPFSLQVLAAQPHPPATLMKRARRFKYPHTCHLNRWVTSTVISFHWIQRRRTWFLIYIFLRSRFAKIWWEPLHGHTAFWSLHLTHVDMRMITNTRLEGSLLFFLSVWFCIETIDGRSFLGIGRNPKFGNTGERNSRSLFRGV